MKNLRRNPSGQEVEYNNEINNNQGNLPEKVNNARNKPFQKTLSKLFRDQYMETFEIGRGKAQLRRKSTTQMEIDEAFGEESSQEHQQHKNQIKSPIEEDNRSKSKNGGGAVMLSGRNKRKGSIDSNGNQSRSEIYNSDNESQDKADNSSLNNSQEAVAVIEKLNKKKNPELLEVNLKDLLSFKQKLNVDNNLKKEQRRKNKLKQKLQNGEEVDEIQDLDYYNMLDDNDQDSSNLITTTRQSNVDSIRHTASSGDFFNTIVSNKKIGSFFKRNKENKVSFIIKQNDQSSQNIDLKFQKQNTIMQFEELEQMRKQVEYFESLKWLKNNNGQMKARSQSQRNLKKCNQKKILNQQSFREYLDELILKRKVVPQLQNKLNLQRLVIKMNENVEEQIKVKNQRNLLKQKFQLEKSKPILLQGGPSLKKNYFIKKEFITVNPLNLGITGKLNKNDIKHYLSSQPNYQAAIAENMQVSQMDQVMDKFFSQTKGVNFIEDKSSSPLKNQTFKKRIENEAAMLNAKLLTSQSHNQLKISHKKSAYLNDLSQQRTIDNRQPQTTKNQFNQKKNSLFNLSLAVRNSNGSVLESFAQEELTLDGVTDANSKILPKIQQNRLESVGAFENVNIEGIMTRTMTLSPKLLIDYNSSRTTLNDRFLQEMNSTKGSSTQFNFNSDKNMPLQNSAFRHKQFVSQRGGLNDNHFLLSHQYSKFNPPLFLNYRKTKAQPIDITEQIVKGKSLIKSISCRNGSVNRKFLFL
eukprot:403338600